MNSPQQKDDRILSLYTRLQKGDVIRKREEAQRFGVTEKSIQRDIDTLRAFLESEHAGQTVVYDKRLSGYRLDTETGKLSNSEILAVCKILLESRSLPRADMNSLLDKLLACCVPENNKKQAYVPSRAEVFINHEGSAPGFALEKDGKYVICMPGPPREMTSMFEDSVMPYLQSMSEDVIYYRMLRAFGIGESALETKLLDLIDDQTDPTLATYAKEGECSLRIASKRKTEAEAREAVDEMVEKVKERVGEFIYSCDDEELVQVVCRKLMEKGLTLSSAESCTGGKFAAAVTDIPGISAVFQRGLVTYSNQAKMDELGVKAETLEKYGAVSEETAMEMVEGLRRVSGSDVCVSVTGIAGPGGGSDAKPVGLVYIGFVYGDKKLCRKLQTGDDSRQWNRQYSLLSMLDIINKNI